MLAVAELGPKWEGSGGVYLSRCMIPVPAVSISEVSLSRVEGRYVRPYNVTTPTIAPEPDVNNHAIATSSVGELIHTLQTFYHQ